MDNKNKIEEYLREPVVPPWYVILGLIFAIIGLLWNNYHSNYADFYILVIVCMAVIIVFLLYFSWRCHKNKQLIYNAYDDERKLAKTQSTIRENTAINYVKLIQHYRMIFRMMRKNDLSLTKKGENKNDT